MLAYTLESLVLRGVSVLRDGQANGVCLGTSQATARSPEVRVSMRHPSPGYPQAQPNAHAERLVVAKRDADDAAFGAGRSRGLAGVLSRRSPASRAGRTAPCWRSREGRVIARFAPGACSAWRRTAQGRSSSVMATARLPFAVAAPFTAEAVPAST